MNCVATEIKPDLLGWSDHCRVCLICLSLVHVLLGVCRKCVLLFLSLVILIKLQRDFLLPHIFDPLKRPWCACHLSALAKVCSSTKKFSTVAHPSPSKNCLKCDCFLNLGYRALGSQIFATILRSQFVGKTNPNLKDKSHAKRKAFTSPVVWTKPSCQ